MVTLLREGKYKLIETKGQVKILTIEKRVFAWIWVKGIGEILVTSHSPHATDHILATGRFRLYEVKDEPKLSDQQHLELVVGDRLWQGYLLPTGLPTDQHKRARIIPTREVISVPISPD